ncbi:hypothetical protein [Yersinia pekkanenii]|uniref:Uncharacterized protein n=1 Tax=Yersinia pekkanenii TaxID=1288385 RepID=A0A0T9RE92_9GAMM|nr:hypothetical protein [Yersinia pekkanenii]CNI58482.1 Uncharacterised protein [Yersinia pekkanenii]CRY69460.1 Uncharacterised protein [Yersinia pekkanenii]
MEIQFSINAEDVSKLREEIIINRLVDYDNRLKKMDPIIVRYVSFYFKVMVPFLIPFILFYFPVLGGRAGGAESLFMIKPESIIALISAAVLYIGLWHRYGHHLIELLFKTKMRSRIVNKMRSMFIHSISRSITQSVSRLEGVHRVGIQAEHLNITGPTGSTERLPFHKIVSVSEKDDYYQIAT